MKRKFQLGFALMLPIIIVVILGFVVLLMMKGKVPRRTGQPGRPPTTFNLGVRFDKWDESTNMAGDFLFVAVPHYNNKVFLENGELLGDHKRREIIPHPMYVLPPGTNIMSVTDGVVKEIKYQKEHDDYSLVIYPNDSSWTIDYDHVANVKVGSGDKVTAGDVIAEVPLATGGLKQYNLGFTEIMIFKDSRNYEDNQTACLYDLLDPSVKDRFDAKIQQLVADWEEFMGDRTIYDEDSWESVGCIYNQITEGEAMRGGK